MDGLAPAIAIKQKNQTRNPRSTVATATEIYDYLRLLYARCGTVTCLHCGGIVCHDTVDEIVAALLTLPEGTRAYALFPIVRAQVKLQPLQPASAEVIPKPTHPNRRKRHLRNPQRNPQSSQVDSSAYRRLKDRLTEFRRRGYNRLYQAGKLVEFSTPNPSSNSTLSPAHLCPHRPPRHLPDIRSRIVDAIETGYRESGEVQFLTVPRDDEREPHQLPVFRRLRVHHLPPRLPRARAPPLFLQQPIRRLPALPGLRQHHRLRSQPNHPRSSRSLPQGAIAPWTTPKYRPFHGEMIRAAKSAAIPTDVPWYDLDPPQQERFREGHGTCPGIRGFFAALERKKYKLHVRVFLSSTAATRSAPTAAASASARKPAPSSSNRMATENICEVPPSPSPPPRLLRPTATFAAQMEIAGKILEEVRQRIHFLHEVGLDYLTLDRLSSTLSGGESQRIQLATSLGSRLVGALYVLDEPSIGLHTRDTAKLIRILQDLRDLGNTILVVEHDPDVIRAADYLLDLGPGAGELGGQLLAAGTVPEVTDNPAPSPANTSPAA